MENNIIFEAKVLCSKFINKVETGRARSVETYQDCKNLLELIHQWESKQIKTEKLMEGFDETSN